MDVAADKMSAGRTSQEAYVPFACKHPLVSLSTRSVLRYYGIAPTFVRPNHAARYLVGPAAPGLPGARCVYRLLNLGGLSGYALFLRQLHLTLLLTGNFWRFPA